MREEEVAPEPRALPREDEPALEEARERLAVHLVHAAAARLEVAQPPRLARRARGPPPVVRGARPARSGDRGGHRARMVGTAPRATVNGSHRLTPAPQRPARGAARLPAEAPLRERLRGELAHLLERRSRPAGSEPPACARSGLPPPEPPTSFAASFTRSPAFTLRGEVLRDRHEQDRLAVLLRRRARRRPCRACRAACRRARAAPCRRPARARRAPSRRPRPAPARRGRPTARRRPSSCASSSARSSSRSAPLGLLDLLRHLERARLEERRRAAQLVVLALRGSTAPGPVNATMRRTPAAIDSSLPILKKAMSPVRRTWVPPQSSFDGPIRTTRTHVAVLLAEDHHRAGLARVLELQHRGVGLGVLADQLVHAPLHASQLVVGERLEVREVEAEVVRRDHRARLLHVLARASRAARSGGGGSPSGSRG